jgi:hypothetical protein
MKCIISKNYVEFIILQGNVGRIKEENYMDVLIEENSIGAKTDEAYIPSAFWKKMAESEVGLFSAEFCVSYSCLYIRRPYTYVHMHARVCFFLLQYVNCIMTSKSESADNALISM